MAYHFWWGPHRVLRGGWVGVDVFFALSGFLITSLLLDEFQRCKDINLRRFYRRRWRRLGPAIIAFTAAWWAAAAVLGTFHLAASRFTQDYPWRVHFNELLGVVTFSTNWLGIHGIRTSAGYGGIWSLAVEEQFYLVWPVLLLLLLRSGRPGLVGFCAAIAAVVSAAECFLLWNSSNPDASQLRIYFATDTRMQGLLIGALGAFAVAAGWRIQKAVHMRLAVLGVLAIIEIAWLVDDTSPLRCLGSFTIAALATTVILTCVGTYDSWLAKGLSVPVLRYVGNRSYALYLYHIPIAGLTRPYGTVGLLAGVGLAFLLAEASWQLVERWFSQKRNPRQPGAGLRRVAGDTVWSNRSVSGRSVPGRRGSAHGATKLAIYDHLPSSAVNCVGQDSTSS
jgi:peptidoglycan/LPS O-acetylase OafA/YrhL